VDTLSLSPKFVVHEQRLLGRTPWLVRLLWLFSYDRSVVVDRGLDRVSIATQRLWLWRRTRTVVFSDVSRIIYRAQGIPSLSLLRLVFGNGDGAESAFFLISLALRNGEELELFTVWEQQPRAHDWLDRIAGVPAAVDSIGDEAAGAVVELLRTYIGVHVAQH
jgi:hypothetical protein